MQLSQLLGPDLRSTLASDPAQLEEALQELHAEDVAELLVDLPDEDVLKVMGMLPLELAADVVERLPLEPQKTVLLQLSPEHAAALVREMDADDRANLFRSLPLQLRTQILAHVEQQDPEVAADVRALTAYAPETAGGIMTTEYVAMSPATRVDHAIQALRRLTRDEGVETIYYIYVVAYGGKLVGVLSLRDLILSEADQPLSEVMTENVVWVAPTTDQEEVARTMAKYDFAALPVVDERTGRLVGVVTIDDVVDVVIEEATEDAQKMGAVEPIEEPYFATGVWTFIRKRIIWLVVLFLGELLTATVMETYAADLAAVLDLAIFIPLIISSGGNSGSQSSSLVIRALALGEMQPRDWLTVLWRELRIGISLGLVLGGVGFLRVWMGHAAGAPHDVLRLGVTVAGSILAVVTMGSLTGSLLPLLIKRLGLDPAVSSTPFVASLVDVLGLAVYFTLARLAFAAVL